MSGNEENFEKLIARLSKAFVEKHRHEISKVSQSLKNVSPEIRKREANPAIYLARYE